MIFTRRERDSNPRKRMSRLNGLAISRFRPLSHLSFLDNPCKKKLLLLYGKKKLNTKRNLYFSSLVAQFLIGTQSESFHKNFPVDSSSCKITLNVFLHSEIKIQRVKDFKYYKK